MRAIGYYKSLPPASDQSLVDLTLPAPAAGPHDLLFRVHAISVALVVHRGLLRRHNAAKVAAISGKTAVLIG
jgi:hypothetical protein